MRGGRGRMTDGNRCKLLIIGSGKPNRLSRRLLEESEQCGVDVTISSYSEIDISIGAEFLVFLNGERLPYVANAVILGSTRYYLALRDLLVHYLLEQKIPLLNGNSFIRWNSMHKLAQHYELQRSGISVVPTQYFGSSFNLLLASARLENQVNIVKSIYGASGNEVYQITSHRELLAILGKHLSQELIMQPMLINFQEFRVIVLDGEVLGSVRKLACPGQFKANWSQGASFETAEPPNIVKDAAVRSCEALQCNFAGVDIIYDGAESCWTLEVNRYCEFGGFEQATRINVAAALLEWIESQVNRT
jgi:glutathione synthase/RimK-type ligase-like ATP-grasp enzyme